MARGARALVLVLVPLSCADPEPPGPDVVSAEPLGTVAQSDRIEGRDGGSSARAWGRSIWAFGDTVLRTPDGDGESWHHNSFAVTLDTDASDGIALDDPLDEAGAPRYLVPPTPSEEAYNAAHRGDPCAEAPCGARWAAWPGEPIHDAAGDRALVFYGLVHAQPGDFAFEGVGGSIAIWDAFDAEPRRPEVEPGAEHPTLVFRATDPSFGFGVHIDDPYLYSYACDQDELEHVCRLGRVQLGHELERSAWEMFDGSGWVHDLSRGAVLFTAAPIVSIHRLRATGQWLAVYTPPFDRGIFARVADERTGPWSAPSLLHRVEAAEGEPYDAVLHPEFEEADGLVQYVTYSRPTEGWFGRELALLRVELAGPP
jgi:hypothetical protein